MNDNLANNIGQNLIAIGLFTVAFESMVLTIRAQAYGYFCKNDPTSLSAFDKACDTADKTIKFCAPVMRKARLVDEVEIDALARVRQRRNKMAHEGYNHMFTLKVKDVAEDVELMLKISAKVEQWRQLIPEPLPDGRVPFSVSPSIFGLYLSVAQDLACTKLYVEEDETGRA
ncbi:hypothetical protein [Burkholderia aenigmatica]|uniref:Uncharacterized protein n=1 Tax=Burkholderia aenigmatica TaxID=2015348 RepID=A0A228IJ40_9BURK|nr:hypothetical protein [Burkholderia aenigmatica]OXI42453.1 hypothetical protein CFB84_24910 [Burkholderia aenigmatica]